MTDPTIKYVQNMEEVSKLLKEAPAELVQLRRSPHISRAIDNTALDAFMACPRRYLYGMVLNRRKEGSPPPAISYGAAWHKALEAHYKTGGDYHKVVTAVVNSWEPHDRPDDYRTVERVLAAYDEYQGRWGTHDDDARTHGATVGYPDQPLVEIPTEISWPGALHPYAGRIDRIIEIGGLYYVEDHKTSSRMGERWSADWDPSNQMMGYVWLAQKLTGLKIQGVRINFHAVLKTQNKFDRAIVSFSQARLEEWANNYNDWINRIEASSRLIIGGVMPDETAFPMNLNACKGKYGFCTYRDVCTSPPRLRQRVLEADFAEKPWDPMAADSEDSGEYE